MNLIKDGFYYLLATRLLRPCFCYYKPQINNTDMYTGIIP